MDRWMGAWEEGGREGGDGWVFIMVRGGLGFGSECRRTIYLSSTGGGGGGGGGGGLYDFLISIR